MTAFVLFFFFLFWGAGSWAARQLWTDQLDIYTVYTVHLRSGVKALESKHKHKERKQGEKKGGGNRSKQTKKVREWPARVAADSPIHVQPVPSAAAAGAILEEYVGENPVNKVDHSVGCTHITLDHVRHPVDPRQFTYQSAWTCKNQNNVRLHPTGRIALNWKPLIVRRGNATVNNQRHRVRIYM